MASFVLRFKPWVALAWIALSIWSVATVNKIGPRLDYTYTTPGEMGYESNRHIEQRFGIDPEFEAMLPVLDLPQGLSMSSEGAALAAGVFSALPKAGVLCYADYANTRDSSFLLDEGRATWALVSIANPDFGAGRGVEGRIEPTLSAATPAGAMLTMTGFAKMLSNAGPNRANLMYGILAGAGLAFIALFLVYGSPIAILPIVMAIPAICVTFFCVLALTYLTHVSYFIEYMVVVLSLGLSIDFSLIIVVRWREERVRGLENEAAILAALQKAGRAVALSGLTAASGLLSLIVLPIPFLRSVGFGSMLIPFVAVCIALTLLPVTLAWFGPALDRFSLWPRAATIYSRGWEGWARFVLRHRVLAAATGLVLLAIMSVPAWSLKAGMALIGSLSPEGPAAAAFHRLQDSGVPSGIAFPIYVMTHGGQGAATKATSIARNTPGVWSVLAPDNACYRHGEDALLTVIPHAEGSLDEGKAVVTTLRQELAALPGGPAWVGGATAGDVSFSHAVYGSFPLMLTVVSLATLIILTLSLRSPVLAIKAVLLNIVSLGAAFGFMVFFWQQGHGSELIYGMSAAGAIRAWIPTIVFASLFGLSMDYEVFVLSRIREEYERTGSTADAIIGGMARSGRLVTCAALILMITFLSVSIDPNQIVKIMATTLAVGVLVDALIIRSLIVPALVSLMGRWNWWGPGFLRRTGGKLEK